MGTSELQIKLDIINKITELKDVRIIKQLQRFLDFELDKEIYQLSEEQSSRIEEARKEYAQSKILTEEEANQEIEQWLNEK
ncbi:hypothetical protein MQX03_04120 [Chryseobacterium aahli]|uniref:hypothetical protein n=1 Tax=Chryseobacterium aahli TaxID=1278643 RepID=UPI001F625131|nr:hypothetical protein [Chryseobacterium aahli]MCI3936371.1 hypothetical protein [Chryseobacterium aahli]